MRRLALAAALLGCGARPERAEVRIAVPNEEKIMRAGPDIERVRAACEVLTRDALTLSAAQTALPDDALVGLPDADEPSHAELSLAAPADLAAFAAAFGEGTEAPLLHPGAPREILFYPDAHPERAHTCAIVARVGAPSVVVRRDPRI